MDSWTIDKDLISKNVLLFADCDCEAKWVVGQWYESQAYN